MDVKAFTCAWRLPMLGMLVACPLLAFAASPDTMTAAFGKPMPDTVLAQYRGGHAFTFNAQHLNATLFDNEASNNLTGSNLITGDAFAGASGIPTVIQNSGNNVIIQNATILNITVR